MPDLTKIATAEPSYITDGISQAVGVTTSIPASNAVGIVARQAGPILGQSATSNPSSTNHGSPVPLMTDDVGRLVTVHSHVRDMVVSGTATLTSTTQTTILSAAGSGVYLDLTQIVLSNSDSDSTVISIRDTTNGSVKMSVALSRGGNTTGSTSLVVIPFPTSMTQTTANSNWTVQSSSANATVYCYFQAIKNT